MKSLCITGSTASALREIARHVEAAGAKSALAAQRKPEITMGEWHAKVMPTIRGFKDNNENSIKIGRVWE
jgi:NADP-dependent 3-hydroxy acid dehydrogenase YdfG